MILDIFPVIRTFRMGWACPPSHIRFYIQHGGPQTQFCCIRFYICGYVNYIVSQINYNFVVRIVLDCYKRKQFLCGCKIKRTKSFDSVCFLLCCIILYNTVSL